MIPESYEVCRLMVASEKQRKTIKTELSNNYMFLQNRYTEHSVTFAELNDMDTQKSSDKNILKLNSTEHTHGHNYM